MSDKKNMTVLVVDDERALCDGIAMEVEEAGYDVLKAYDGNDALEIINEGNVDLVVSDIVMPKVSGVELLDKVKSQNTMTPVVLFITGFTDVKDMDVYDKGAEAIFAKPVDLDELLEFIDRQLTHPEVRYQKGESPIQTQLELNLKYGEASDKSTVNVSFGRGGFFARIDENIPREDKKVKFSIDCGDNDEVQGIGVVRWKREKSSDDLPSGIGVEFLEVDESSIQVLSSIICRKSSVPFIPKM